MFHILHLAGYKALSFLVLPFLLSHGSPVRNTAPAPHPVVPLRATAVQSGCTLTFSGPSQVPKTGSATYCIRNWNGRCTTWYYNNTYVTTNNGCITIYFNNGSPGSVSAVQHQNCALNGAALACGYITFSFY